MGISFTFLTIFGLFGMQITSVLDTLEFVYHIVSSLNTRLHSVT